MLRTQNDHYTKTTLKFWDIKMNISSDVLHKTLMDQTEKLRVRPESPVEVKNRSKSYLGQGS
jgi:hypothetical protein